jgi:hypothetical protein
VLRKDGAQALLAALVAQVCTLYKTRACGPRGARARARACERGEGEGQRKRGRADARACSQRAPPRA